MGRGSEAAGRAGAGLTRLLRKLFHNNRHCTQLVLISYYEHILKY